MAENIYENDVFAADNIIRNNEDHDNHMSKTSSDISMKNDTVKVETNIKVCAKITWKNIILFCVMISTIVTLVQVLVLALILSTIQNFQSTESNQQVSAINQSLFTKLTKMEGKVNGFESRIKEFEKMADELVKVADETGNKNRYRFHRIREQALYDFQKHTFTTCLQFGNTGPSLASCRNNYSTIWDNNNEFFTMTVSGIQQWTVPDTGIYKIIANGAAGGSGHSGTFNGGKGASVEGTFTLQKSSVINIVVGQMGSNGGSSEPGGGGGGTFVYMGEIGGTGLLVAAGGGGGGGEENTAAGYDGQGNQTSYNFYGYGGTELADNGGIGYGGSSGNFTVAGAGWKSRGGYQNNGNRGNQWIGGSGFSSIGAGGFGGGASGCNTNGGGGGGGYTGGFGVTTDVRNSWGGSGGGSYNSGTDQINRSGYTQGHELVSISKLESFEEISIYRC